MGEITLEKKKQIENYIVASYFDRCKNVEAYCKGGDILKGSDEYNIPDLVVLIDVFGMSGVYIIHWDFLSNFGSELKNEFMVRIATERSITRNRCDSVDALNYSWISWKKQLEEKATFLNDKRKEDLEKEIKELQKENKKLHVENDRLLTVNEEIKKKLQEFDVTFALSFFWKEKYKTFLNTLKAWKEATGCSTPEEANKKLASYEGRLDSVKQSASIAIRHLDNIVFRDDKRSDWSDK